MTLAARQHGCISLAQATALGVSKETVSRRARDRRWERVLPRVYVVRGSPRTWEQRLFAAILWGGPGAVACGRAAAALWGFPGSRRGTVEISLSWGTRAPGGVVVRRLSLHPGDRTVLDGFPVTTAGRTLVDAAVRMRGWNAFDAAFHYCLHERLTDLESLKLLSTRHSGPGNSGGARLRNALAAYAADRPAASPLESRCARKLDRSGLPAARRQYEVRIEGRRRFLDFAWPTQRVALEVDGFRWHSSRAAWESDRARHGELRRAGWTVITATHDDIERRFDRLEAELAALVAR